MIRTITAAIISTLMMANLGAMAQEQSRRPVEQQQQAAQQFMKPDKAMMSQIRKADLQSDRPSDTHSHARPHEAVVTHLDLNLKISFDRKRIDGEARYRFSRTSGDMLVLDSKGLDISTVTDEKGNALRFKLQQPDSIKGSALVIMLTPDAQEVVIRYATTGQSDGLQWLSPEQNDGRTPFLYSQGQAILTRTWIPIQDSPGIRITYNATVTVPAGMTAVMSALGNPQQTSPTVTEFQFKQPYPIPPYLIAIAVGRLGFKAISPRTGIYALPDVLPDAVSEFGQLEEMLIAAEKLCGPYEWERFDVLVLPASFPFGGMENPMLTFATPTILAGDRSLVSLIIHELVHSWSGNLVTNANWNDFWLNEGWTVYLERRLVEMIYGEGLAQMMEVLGFQDLTATIDDLPTDHPDTGLRLRLEGRDPDDGMTDVAYERGAMVIKEMEVAWGRTAFDPFILEYFKAYRFKGITTDEFIRFAEDYRKRTDLKEIPLREMIGAVGRPKPSFKIVSGSLISVEKARVAFLTGRDIKEFGSGNWNPQQLQYFLRILKEPLSPEQIIQLEKTLKPGASNNAEINFEWFILCIRNGHTAIRPQLDAFLAKVGRRKFILPLYRELFSNDQWAGWGRERYDRYRHRYHAITAGSVDRL